MKKLFVIVALLVFLTPTMGRAQFFGGIVYDPTNFHNAVLRYYQLRLQFDQLRSTYQNAVSQYNLAVQMARSIQNMPARYRAQFSNWRNLTVPDAYQNTSGWVQGANSGNLSTVQAGYNQTTNQLERYNSDQLSSMPSDERQRVLANYANVELADGVNTNSLATIGTLRADSPEIQRQIENLQSDSLSNNPQLNSQVAVLNKINAANVLTLRTLQDANNLGLSQLEQQVLASQERRDAMTTAINSDIYQRQNMVPAVNSVTNGLGSSLANYRLP
ncbi:MAG: hypothetical protein EPN47_18375 [Acidobacteria bacterium]|nr:MAG: hypothetical protein EPN47_18375 [Acidobacteriota bacterium]